MPYAGEIISLVVAVSWTATAIFADKASHRLGAASVNVIRMALSIVLLGALLCITIGTPYPRFANGSAWFWLALSALVGYVFGDYCLFNAYTVMGARFGQLFMTLAPLFTALSGWLLLGESMSWKSISAMAVTLSGISMSILSRSRGNHFSFKIPLKGVILGIGAGLGQGVGLVLSKIGVQNYEAGLPAEVPAAMAWALPFASTMIRSIVGAAGFFVMMALSGSLGQLKAAMSKTDGLKYAGLTTLFGPVIGVSLSLMAVQHANAGIASTLMALTPVLILVPYRLVFKQKIALKEVIGAFVSMVGVALFFLL